MQPQGAHCRLQLHGFAQAPQALRLQPEHLATHVRAGNYDADEASTPRRMSDGERPTPDTEHTFHFPDITDLQPRFDGNANAEEWRYATAPSCGGSGAASCAQSDDRSLLGNELANCQLGAPQRADLFFGDAEDAEMSSAAD